MAFYLFTFKLHIFCLLSPVVSSLRQYGDLLQMHLCYTDYYEVRFLINKELWIQYNSTRGNWIGFTQYATNMAQKYNKDPSHLQRRKFEETLFCDGMKTAIKETKNLTTAPVLKMTSLKQSIGTKPALLLCSAYSFYPKDIKMTWLQNGQEVTSAVTSTEVLSDGDWSFQIHSYLEYSPKHGEEISCMVEHVSLSEPLVQVWDPSFPWSERMKIAGGIFYLGLGFLVLLIGFIRDKKFRTAALYCTQYRGCELVPVNDAGLHED